MFNFNKKRRGYAGRAERVRGYLPDILPDAVKLNLSDQGQQSEDLGQFSNSDCSELQNSSENFVRAFYKPDIDATTKRLQKMQAASPEEPNDELEEQIETNFRKKHGIRFWLDNKIKLLGKRIRITSTKVTHRLMSEKLEVLVKRKEEYQQQHADIPAVRSLMDKAFFYYLTVIILFLFELPFTVSVLQPLLPLPMLMIYVVAMLVSSLFFISSHFSTKAFFKKKTSQAILALCVGVGTLVAQVLLRLEHPEGPQGILAILNGCLLCANIVISAAHNEHREYWNTDRAVNRLTKKHGNAEIKIQRHELDLERDEAIFQKKTNTTVDNKTTKKINKMRKEHQQHQDRVEDLTCEIIEQEESQDAAIAYSAAELESRQIKGKNKRKTGLKISGTAASILLMGSILVSGCGEKTTEKNSISDWAYSEIITTEVAHVWDISESSTKLIYPSASAISDHLINHDLRLHDKNNLFNGAIVNLSTISASGLPYVETFKLPEGNAVKLLQNHADRQKTVDSFILVVTAAIERFANMPANAPSTNLHRSLCYLLNQLSASSSSKKILYAFTDGIEASSSFSLSRYKTEQSLKADYNRLTMKMDQVCAPQNLDGISIHQVCTADDALTSELILWANNYLRYYYEDKHGADTVTMLSSLY